MLFLELAILQNLQLALQDAHVILLLELAMQNFSVQLSMEPGAGVDVLQLLLQNLQLALQDAHVMLFLELAILLTLMTMLVLVMMIVITVDRAEFVQGVHGYVINFEKVR